MRVLISNMEPGAALVMWFISYISFRAGAVGFSTEHCCQYLLHDDYVEGYVLTFVCFLSLFFEAVFKLLFRSHNYGVTGRSGVSFLSFFFFNCCTREVDGAIKSYLFLTGTWFVFIVSPMRQCNGSTKLFLIPGCLFACFLMPQISVRWTCEGWP